MWKDYRHHVVGTNILQDPQLRASGQLDTIRSAFSGQERVLESIEYAPNFGKRLRKRWLRMVLLPIKDRYGHVQEVVLFLQDLTPLKEAEAAVSDNEGKWRRLIESSEDALVLLDEQGNIGYQSPAAARISGFEPGELIGTPGIDMVHPDDLPLAASLMERAIINPGVPQHSVHRIRHKSGHWVWTEGTVTSLLQDPNVKGFVSNFRDLTLQRTAEQNYREIFEKGNDAIYVHELGTGRVLEVNERACQISGYTKDEIMNGNPEDLMAGTPGFTLDDAMKHLQRAAQGERHTFEWHARHKNGTLFWVEVSLARATIAGQDRILAFFREIGDRKEKERQIKQLNRTLEQRVAKRTSELEQSNHELESFTYTVSHDLRAPLRAIHGFTRLLSEDYARQLDSEAQEMMQFVLDGVSKMDRLIDDLLGFSRLGRQQLAQGHLDMTRLVESVLRDFETSMPQVAGTHELLPLPAVSADASTMRQVWTNLISNAFKYASKSRKPRIHISGWTAGTDAVYCIQDNGVGFDMKYYDKLFGIFQRLHSQEEFEGTGVGLAIVSRIVMRHGGRVWARASVGEGASFYFSIPKYGEHE
jgi:PAS domain S-box-containing protein